MKGIFFCIFFCSTVISLNSQVIQGKVYDSKSREAVPGVVIYFDGTSIATSSDIDGNFQIEMKHAINTGLVFRHLSYETLIITNPLENNQKSFFLKEKVNTLMEVVVTARRSFFSRQEMMKVFREQFLGVSTAASSSEIINEDDIVLLYDPNSNTLKAYTNYPIIIENKYLAYRISYNLENFSIQYNYRTLSMDDGAFVSYNGTAFFEDQSPLNKIIAKRRDGIYLRSKEHFWKNFIANTLDEAKIFIYNDSRKINSRKYFSVKNLSITPSKRNIVQIIPETNIKRYHKDVKGKVIYGMIEVVCNNNFRSEIVFLTNHFSVTDFGNIDANNIIYLGDMGTQRLCDMLPLDYAYTLAQNSLAL